MTIRVNVDGQEGSAEDPLISPIDQGFLFGASVYETVRTYGGAPFLLARHLKRLRASAETLGIDIALDDDVLTQRVDDTIAAAGNEESSIRIVVSAGRGAIDYRKGSAGKATVVIIVRPLVPLSDDLYRNGAAATLVRGYANRPGPHPRMKSSNLMPNILALRQAHAGNAYEALLLNDAEEVCEGSMSNVFIIRDGEVTTPPVSSGILEGITRELILDIAKEHGVPLAEASITATTLLDSDEVFISASSRQIVPITEVNDSPIGSGTVGPVTNSFMNWYESYVRELMRISTTNQKSH